MKTKAIKELDDLKNEVNASFENYKARQDHLFFSGDFGSYEGAGLVKLFGKYLEEWREEILVEEVKEKPLLSRAYATAAAVFSGLEDEEAARSALKKALRTHKNPVSYYIASHVFESLQDYGKALRYARKLKKSLATLEPTVENILQVEVLKAENDFRIYWLEKVWR